MLVITFPFFFCLASLQTLGNVCPVSSKDPLIPGKHPQPLELCLVGQVLKALYHLEFMSACLLFLCLWVFLDHLCGFRDKLCQKHPPCELGGTEETPPREAAPCDGANHAP